MEYGQVRFFKTLSMRSGLRPNALSEESALDNILDIFNVVTIQDEGLRFKHLHPFTGEQHEYAFDGHGPLNA